MGRHQKPKPPKRTKVILDNGKRTNAQKQHDKRTDKIRRSALAAEIRRNELLRQKELASERKLRKLLRKNKNV
jgi:hypothetical protein